MDTMKAIQTALTLLPNEVNMFKSRCEFLLSQAHKGYYEEICEALEDLFWQTCRDRILGENFLFGETVEEVLLRYSFERSLEHIIWGWYSRGKTFSERYE